MAKPQDIPQIATELVDMSREYMRQEVVEPAKQLGRQAGMGVGGATVASLGAFLLAWALYHLLKVVLPDGEWFVVLARFLTALGAAGALGLVVWRMQRGDH